MPSSCSNIQESTVQIFGRLGHAMGEGLLLQAARCREQQMVVVDHFWRMSWGASFLKARSEQQKSLDALVNTLTVMDQKSLNFKDW